MDRRSFVMSIFGGLAAASLGGTAMVQAASRKPDAAPLAAVGDLDAATKAGLDKTEADFNQVVIRERVVRRRPAPWRRRRPVVVRRRVIVRRPRRRVFVR